MTMRAEWLRGCATALVTPFTKGGAVDEARMRGLVERQIAGGVKLLVPCGTTGESATLSSDEQQRVIAITVAAAKGKARVIAGVGNNNTAVTIERAKAARTAGADAALVVGPYYNKPTQAGFQAHYRAIAAAVPGFPVVVYNVPGRTGSNIAAATTLALAREVESRPDGFKVLSGDDALTLAVIALGGEGIVSVASNEVPDQMSRMTELALAGDWTAARALHYKLLPLMEGNFIESNPGPVKAAMALLGLLEEQFRLPLVPVQESTRARLKEILGQVAA